MRALAAAAVLASLLPFRAAAGGSESSMRCAGGLVSVGDATIDVLGKCGAPALREVRAAESFVAVTTVGPTFGRAAVLSTERWTYDFGPQQFLMFVVVDGGRVVAMERGGYGYARNEVPVTFPRATCEWTSLHVGDAKIDLLGRCGEPALAELRKEGVVEGGPGVFRDAAALSRASLRDVEVWTYDFGPQSFVRFVVLDAGVVVRIDTGNRGFAR
jgi:hypothetical protein